MFLLPQDIEATCFSNIASKYSSQMQVSCKIINDTFDPHWSSGSQMGMARKASPTPASFLLFAKPCWKKSGFATWLLPVADVLKLAFCTTCKLRRKVRRTENWVNFTWKSKLLAIWLCISKSHSEVWGWIVILGTLAASANCWTFASPFHIMVENHWVHWC